MSIHKTQLGELMLKRNKTINPAELPDEKFTLYSIPAFDQGAPDVVTGSSIGSSKQTVEQNDVLLSKIVPHIRRSWIVGGPASGQKIASSEWIVFRSPRFHPPYLRQLLTSNKFHAQFMNTVAGVGGSLLRARPSFVAKIEVSLPSLEEQRKTAKVLDHLESLQAERSRSVELLDELTQSIFLDMFSEMAMDESKKENLGTQIGFLTSGSRGWAKYYSDAPGDVFIRIQNVRMNELDLDDVAYVNAPDTAEAKRTLTQPGDVLLSITADLGRTAVVPVELERAFINQHLSIIRTSSLNPVYLSAYLSSEYGQRQILKKNRAGVKAGLNFNDIRSLEIPIPSRELQDEFASRLESVRRLKTKHLAHLAHLDELFASVQQRAFDGTLWDDPPIAS